MVFSNTVAKHIFTKKPCQAFFNIYFIFDQNLVNSYY
jgi:hypothetical protein